MANQDLAGLLTGISGTQRPNPNQGSDEWRMAFGGQQAQNLGNAVGNVPTMFGGERNVNPQEAIQIGMGKLDQGNIEDLKTLARMQQINKDFAGAARTAAKIQAMQAASETKAQEAVQRAGLSKYVSEKYGEAEVALVEAGVLTAANLGDFVKTRESQGSFKGESFKVKDSKDNLFAAISVYNKDARQTEVSYTNLNPDGPATPIGAVTPVGGVYSLTGDESVELAWKTTGAKTSSDLFTKRKAVAGDNYTRANIALQDGTKMLNALKEIRTGGALTNLSKEVTDFLGTTPTSVTEFERLAKEKILAGLKRLGANPTEGEREFAIQLGESLKKSKGANEAQIQYYMDEMARVMSRERYLLNPDVTWESFNEYTLNQWGDSNNAESSTTTDGNKDIVRVNFSDLVKG